VQKRLSDSSVAVAIPKNVLRWLGYAVAAVVAAVIVILIVIAISNRVSGSDEIAAAINSKDYQAVFLTSSEVYFGKMTHPGGDTYYLTHVYRLTAQPSTRRGQPLQRTLVKLTSDVHSPEDLLIINRHAILYVENLSPSGKAAQLMNAGGP
jgi:hypothetical protein